MREVMLGAAFIHVNQLIYMNYMAIGMARRVPGAAGSSLSQSSRL
ncbi:hypothetical protein CBM2589_A70058 [Cupriavidus taiwanensis]|uniref:Uncharacterized protein n=1 Tax=Cupriavidus taiwanensis TaxID=164546 RepID=A0A375C723_9BURK|nr:hypothetical protein CBM2589_A70058 [Cupriavidus taiwanensis]